MSNLFVDLPMANAHAQAPVDSGPRVSQAHLFVAANRVYLLVADGSRVYELPADDAKILRIAIDAGDRDRVDEWLRENELTGAAYVDDTPIAPPPVRSLSLAVAQACNLGCSYCYAQGGEFGGEARNMPVETAFDSVDALLNGCVPGDRVNLAFLGGEPMINREVIRAATIHLATRAGQLGVRTAFSITTNGTLLTADDADFFEEYGYAVTISIDGIGDVHDGLRPARSGAGSYDRIVERAQPLLRRQRKMQVSARATVTPSNLDLRTTLDTLIGMGFHSVGFSPMLSSPTSQGEMSSADLQSMLTEMVTCGMEFERRVIAGERYPFLNLVNALEQIHRGTHRPYPCGAGAGYLGVSAEGDAFACHRFVDDPRGRMGSIRSFDNDRRAQWLADRHVHRQQPCSTCWARYLCGGGCHYEVIHRGRSSCDYIRGWLDYCLQAYVRLLAARPDYFG